ncbi:tRNA uracil 4-sulfurtransferase ThiI [Chelativorans sp. YIM 93263]|uniref:tRNA uracil 4-sulfurtransferase ThiI n=1 Tax=Chelativorans sp. YIM 93263 TaxID=2906648 RepID=UPI002379E9CC|nr:tRNA uracil 4-sulfurtransferase ThiI [Chelativorans sp. YIM 93263]
MKPLFIVRFSADFATKSPRTRSHFSSIMRKNVHAALAGAGVRARIVQKHGRLFIFASDEARTQAILGRIFGLSNFSPVLTQCRADLTEMARTAEEAFARKVEGKRYAVRARRSGQHPFRSVEVERHLGATLNPYATVNLDNPDITVHVEILGNRAYFFTDRIDGAGGLPLGSEGRALVLFSGGFDSAVAAWRMMRRGVAVDFLFCNLAGGAYERQVIQVAKVLTDLWAFGEHPRLYVLDLTGALDELRARVERRFWQIVLKRLMYRAASSVAPRLEAQAIITGEAVGQVSSQTLSNLRSIEPAADLPVLRPLIGFDKAEIISQARHIGTALLSERIVEHCGLSGGSPAVRSTASKIAAEEAEMDGSALHNALSNLRQIDLGAVTASDLQTDYLFVDDVPENAEVIDCQPPAHYKQWHLPGAVNRSPESVIHDLKSLDKRQSYVLYCPFGTQSAHVAEIMQQYGYQAYALRGGIGAIRQRNDQPEMT